MAPTAVKSVYPCLSWYRGRPSNSDDVRYYIFLAKVVDDACYDRGIKVYLFLAKVVSE